MSSLSTSSPVSASTLAYLIRWPVLRFNWLKLTFSDSEVAGSSVRGQVTHERRRKRVPCALGVGRPLFSEAPRPLRFRFLLKPHWSIDISQRKRSAPIRLPVGS